MDLCNDISLFRLWQYQGRETCSKLALGSYIYLIIGIQVSVLQVLARMLLFALLYLHTWMSCV